MITGFTSICRSSARALAMSAAAAVLFAGIATVPAPASAQDILAGKSGGLLRCVRGVLLGGRVRHVKVKGHHFHCKQLATGEGGERLIWLTHEQFGRDDNIRFRFRVDPWNKIVTDSLKVEINKGFSIYSLNALFPLEFKGPSNPGRRDYDAFVKSARKIGNGKVKKWESAASAVATIVIAQIGAGPLARHTTILRDTATTTMKVGR